MLIIEFEEGQGLGNQLWNYAVLRSLAKHNSYNFYVKNIDNFKGKKFLNIKSKDTNQEINFKEFSIVEEKCFYDHELNCFAYGFDKNLIKINDNIILKGNLQSENYLMPNIEVINDFINIKNFKRANNYEINKTCIINLRGGEYKMHRNLILPKSYWLNAIKNMKKINPDLNFKIITDDEIYASKILPEYEVIRGNIMDDFLNLYYSKFVIISNSSFAYFPLKLGNKPNIVIAPANWSRFGNKYNRWVSTCNYYRDWIWQDQNGVILSKQNSDEIVKNTEKYYKSFYILSHKKNLSKRSLKNFLPKRLRKKMKIILSKIFPVYFG